MEKPEVENQGEQPRPLQPGQAPQDQEYVRLLERMKKDNALRRRYYATGQLSKADRKKVRTWLDHKDQLTIITDADNAILILNETAIGAMSKSRKLFYGKDTRAEKTFPGESTHAGPGENAESQRPRLAVLKIQA